MFVVRVLPLTPLPPAVPQVLDCLWGDALPRGAVVRAPLGRRAVKAVVLGSTDATRAKLSLKRASFGLKRLTDVLCAAPQASEAQLALIAWLAHYYASGPSSSAHAVLPAWLGSSRTRLSPPTASHSMPPSIAIVVTDPDASAARIRTTLKRTSSQVLVVAPELSVVRAIASRLASAKPLVIHGALGLRASYAAHVAVASGDARLVVGTRSALFLPWSNLGHVLVEDANSDTYKSESAPRFFAPDVARKLAELHGASLTLMVPALSAVQRRLTLGDSVSGTHEKPFWPSVSAVSMRSVRGVLAPETEDAIDRTLADAGRVLVVSPRRAWAGSLRCRVCRVSVACRTCLTPMRVHEPAPSERMLVCYHCNAFENPPRVCPSCATAGSLAPAGHAGSQRIAAAVRRLLERRAISGVSTTVFDTDLLRTPALQEAAAAAFADNRACVVVASQLILPYRWRMDFGLVAVVDADALAWHPDYRSHERLVATIEKLADFRPSRMLIQYAEDGGPLPHAHDRSWDRFLDAELRARKSLRWPPFVRLAAVTATHTRRATASRSAAVAADRLRRASAAEGVSRRVMVSDPVQGLAQRAGGRWSASVLVRTDLDAQRFSSLLAVVPPDCTVDVDPRSIL